MGIGDKNIGGNIYPTYEKNIMGTKSGIPDSRNINEAIKQADLWEKSNWNKEIKNVSYGKH